MPRYGSHRGAAIVDSDEDNDGERGCTQSSRPGSPGRWSLDKGGRTDSHSASCGDDNDAVLLHSVVLGNESDLEGASTDEAQDSSEHATAATATGSPIAPSASTASLPQNIAMGRCAFMAWNWISECPNRWTAQLLSTHLHELMREAQFNGPPSAREAVDDVRRIFVHECQTSRNPAGLPYPLPRFVVVADVGGHRLVMHSNRSELIMAFACFRPDLTHESALRVDDSTKRLVDAVHQARASAAEATAAASAYASCHRTPGAASAIATVAATHTSLVLYYSSPKAAPVAARHYEMRVTMRAPNADVAGVFHVIDGTQMMTANDVYPRPGGSTAETRESRVRHTPSPLPDKLPTEWAIASMDVEDSAEAPSRGDLSKMRKKLLVARAAICGLKNQRVSDKEQATQAIAEAKAETRKRVEAATAERIRLELLLGEDRASLERSNGLLQTATKGAQSSQRLLDRVRSTARSETTAMREEIGRLRAALRDAEAEVARVEEAMVNFACRAEVARTNEGVARELQAEADEAAVRARIDEAVRGAAEEWRSTDLNSQATEARNEHETEVANLLTTNEAKVATMQSEHEATVATLQTEHEAKVATLRTEHKTEVATLRTEHKTEVATLRTEYETKVATLQTEHETKIATLHTEHEHHEAAPEKVQAGCDRTPMQGYSDALVPPTPFASQGAWPQHYGGGWAEHYGGTWTEHPSAQFGLPAYGAAYCQPLGGGGGGWYAPAPGLDNGGLVSNGGNLGAAVATMATCVAQLAQHVGATGPDINTTALPGYAARFAPQFAQQFAPPLRPPLPLSYDIATGGRAGNQSSCPHEGGRGGPGSGGVVREGARPRGAGGSRRA